MILAFINLHAFAIHFKQGRLVENSILDNIESISEIRLKKTNPHKSNFPKHVLMCNHSIYFQIWATR